MKKFLANTYYTLLIIVVINFTFNLAIREHLLHWIYNTSPDESVTDIATYTQETILRSIFSWILLILMITIAIVSIILLWAKEGKQINKFVLIGVPIFVVYCLFLGLISGSFN
jgi:hypothetical protein